MPIRHELRAFDYLRVLFILNTLRSWKKNLSPQAVAALEKTGEFLTLGHYSDITIRNYLGELGFLFSYYPDVAPLDFDSEMVMQYLLYITKTLGCGRSKCCMAGQSISFFFRHVLQKPYVIPTLIYPRKVKTLPAVMSAKEILKIINAVDNIKHRAMLILL